LPFQFNTGLSNTDAGDFTIRVFNGASDCFTDYTVIQADGSLIEIGSPWLGSTGSDPNQQPVRYPHGIVTDVNGFVYIGDVDDFGNNGGIVKLTCDGTVVDFRRWY